MRIKGYGREGVEIRGSVGIYECEILRVKSVRGGY